MQHPIDKAGGPTKVAQVFGLTTPSVIQWRSRGIPIERCPRLERELGVMRWESRPQDWHLIWPELIGHPDAPPLPADQRAEA